MYYDKLASELDNLLEIFGTEIDIRLENINTEDFKNSIIKSEEKLTQEYLKIDQIRVKSFNDAMNE